MSTQPEVTASTAQAEKQVIDESNTTAVSEKETIPYENVSKSVETEKIIHVNGSRSKVDLYDPHVASDEGQTAQTSSDDCQTESDSEDDKSNIEFIRWGRPGDDEQIDRDRPVFQVCGKTMWVYGSLVAERKVCFPFLGCSCCCFFTTLCCLVNVLPALHEHTL